METEKIDLLEAARGLAPADIVCKNAQVFNPFTCSFETGTLAIKDGIVLGIGDYNGKTVYDFSGLYIIPGLIDAHVHIESSLLTPRDYARLTGKVRKPTSGTCSPPAYPPPPPKPAERYWMLPTSGHLSGERGFSGLRR
jgi:adenine deaminase